jgi:hypothetical protein
MRILSTLLLLLLLLYNISAKIWELFQAISSSFLWVIRGAKNEAKYRLNEEEIKWLRKQAFISFE